MSIFASPMKETEETSNTGTKVLFLHGLEGSPDGDKSKHLKKKWNASTPALRTNDLRSLRLENPGTEWLEMPRKEYQKALDVAYKDAISALVYMKPDIIVGSSMGGALLAQMVTKGVWTGPCVFLAPGITPLLGQSNLPEMESSVWILAEVDTVVPNGSNIRLCKNVRGNLLISPEDTHRLHKALETGLIDAAIVTALEIEARL